MVTGVPRRIGGMDTVTMADTLVGITAVMAAGITEDTVVDMAIANCLA